MNAEVAPGLWWPTFGLLALESTLVIGVGALCGWFVRSAVWRRTIGQACLVTLLALVIAEGSGTARSWFSSWSVAPTPSPRPDLPATARQEGTAAQAAAGDGERVGRTFSARNPAPRPVSPDVSSGSERRSGPQTSLPARMAQNEAADSAPAGSAFFGWAVVIWVFGTAALLMKSLFSRLLLALLRWRSRPVEDPRFLNWLGVLRQRMTLRRRVRLFESERLSSPVACGLFRPAIGLPRHFMTNEDPTRQEVMLLHELAHIQAMDSAWYWLADGVVALLWWQPLVWWMRRRLQAASECAADEASLLAADGPVLLAECLVKLGQRLSAPQPSGWLGVEGGDFRSGLGRRVERLLKLEARSWQPPKRVASALARTLAPAGLIAVVVLATAWTIPITSTKGENMSSIPWTRSMMTFALASVLGTQTTLTVAAEAEDAPRAIKPGQAGSGSGGRGGGTGLSEGGQGGGAGQREQGPGAGTGLTGSDSKATAKLKAKLDSIVLDEVLYDCLPLAQVIEQLIAQSAKRDPDKAGINFLMGKATDFPAPSVDPATGLPIAAPEPIDLGSVTICIRLPLKKVRLSDVLDAITRVADRPIKYSVEEYAVVWTPGLERRDVTALAAPVSPVVPQVRAFKFDTNLFLTSLEKAFGIRAEHNSNGIRAALWDKVFPQMGVKLHSETSALIYNEVNGVLLIRTLPENLAAIQATVETLGGKPTVPESMSASLKR